MDDVELAINLAWFAHPGIFGLAVQGTDDEVVHLTNSGKNPFTFPDRKAYDEARSSNVPITVGYGSHGAQETIHLCRESWLFGGEYALVLPPSDYSSMLAGAERELESFEKDLDVGRLIPAEPLPAEQRNDTFGSCQMGQQRSLVFSPCNMPPHKILQILHSSAASVFSSWATFKRHSNERAPKALFRRWQPYGKHRTNNCAVGSPIQSLPSRIGSHSSILGIFRAMSSTLRWQ